LTGTKHILKKIIPPFILDIYHGLRKKEDYTDPIRDELIRIGKLPRFRPGSFYTDTRHKISFTDSLSFLNMYESVFDKGMYNFRSEKSDPFIIDAGANIGISVLYFKKIYPHTRILAFEPDPNIFKTLEKNVKAYELDDVTLVNKALWHIESSLSFHSEGADAGKIAQTDRDENILEIQSALLSSYIGDRDIDLLKIDIEGAEYNVLYEIRDSLKNVKNIFIEFHSFANEEQRLAEILALLKEAGFRAYITSSGPQAMQPFMEIYEVNGFDNLLHIFGLRA
jgi:FkbM family methyltransferase